MNKTIAISPNYAEIIEAPLEKQLDVLFGDQNTVSFSKENLADFILPLLESSLKKGIMESVNEINKLNPDIQIQIVVEQYQ